MRLSDEEKWQKILPHLFKKKLLCLILKEVFKEENFLIFLQFVTILFFHFATFYTNKTFQYLRF